MKFDREQPPAGILSLPTSIPPSNKVAMRGFSTLTMLAPPPHGAPCALAATVGIRACIAEAFKAVATPNQSAKEIEDYFSALQDALAQALGSADAKETFTSLTGTKVRHAEWNLLAVLGQKSGGHKLARLFLGLKCLIAIKDKKALGQSTASRTIELLRLTDLSEPQISSMLNGATPDSALGQSWIRDICRSWRDVMRHFSNEPPPPPNIKARIASQILDATLNTTAQRRGGARTHRQLSNLQLPLALSYISKNIEMDTLTGAAGVIVCISTFSIDVAAQLPLSGSTLELCSPAEIDLDAGTLKVDYGLIYDQASLPISGAIPSSYICSRALPSSLVENLRLRAQKYPQAQMLQDLYPDDAAPAHDAAVYVCTDQIQPTWARLRRTVGTFLREQSFDNLIASAVSGDLTHIPRSKLFYACVGVEEIVCGLRRFYALAGWAEPYATPALSMGFGCRVVPTKESLLSLELHWAKQVQEARPGKNSGLEPILNFHYQFMRWAGMRLSLQLALRESTGLELSAEIQELHDRWIPVHDKHVPGDQGHLPMPLTKTTQHIIKRVRQHCQSMEKRLRKKGQQHTDLARWCRSVNGHQNVPLLCIAESCDALRPVATSDFTGAPALKLLVPPDFGRKAMENLLRAYGMHATEIDAFLRHSVLGQSRNSATSDVNASDWWKRADTAITNITASIFKEDFLGLSKE